MLFRTSPPEPAAAPEARRRALDNPRVLIAAALLLIALLVGLSVLSDRTTSIRASVSHVEMELVLAVVMVVLVIFASWLACQLFAGRAAFLLVGAMLATTMALMQARQSGDDATYRPGAGVPVEAER